jgi:hypothetical protein
MNAQKFKKIMAEVRSEMNKISDIQEELFMNTMKAALIKEESDAYFHAWDYLYNSKDDEHFAKTSMDNLLKSLHEEGHKLSRYTSTN